MDGCKQREKNADAMSPMVSTEAVLIYAVIDTYKERDLVVVDIAGVYLSKDMNNNVYIIFWWKMS